MTFNNTSIVTALGDELDTILKQPTGHHARRRPASKPCLPERLPTTSFIQREAETLAPKELVRQMLKSSMEENVEIDGAAEPEEVIGHRRARSSSSARSASSIRSFVQTMVSPRLGRTPSGGWTNLQPYEVMKAIEEKDIMFLMEVRDKAFPLLLQSSGGETPLVHAIRTGNKDVAIVLLGAFSRWVNYLEDADVQKPQIQTYLKALRVGLKLAINEGLAKSQNELIASFMQTLIMSEGDKWVYAQVSTVSRALNSGTEGKPVQVAGGAVRKFATKELGKADLIASLEDYVSNATADLLMMGAWTNVKQTVKGDALPSYYFARDDRVYKAFTERLDRHKSEIQRTCSRRLRWQLQVLREVLEGRSVTFRRKVEILANRLDEGEGV
ncbi:hypothetical protein GALMADRAFT_262202 [Galerina marginata CBS 339.88]|uniref:Uncharacterized protein n=1 Tax=Galerina marginata (strain CBS 339.88) TaxID=685588 RepID=A0A067TKS3_GALM3|nr:hypothetical protein GALMADRAFT_262202 [Galerina marginata CBS 339.88]